MLPALPLEGYSLSSKGYQVINGESVNVETSFLKLFFCSSWYLKAQHIAPKNGRPYNQLALLAVYTVRNFGWGGILQAIRKIYGF